MVNDVYGSVHRYFNTLTNTGYVKQKDVDKLLLYTSIQELLDNDFRGLVTEEDYQYINRALYCLYGSTCLIPFPDYYNNKNKRVMYIVSMSELAHRVEVLEGNIENLYNKEVVIPGDEVSDVEDFTV